MVATISSRAEVENLLAETVPAAQEREMQAFDVFAGDSNRSIVLFGAGGLGKRCLAGLRHHGIEPIAFADNNAKLWNSQVDRLTVLEPAAAARQFGKSAVFVITIWGALSSDRMRDREAQLRSLGCEKVIPFGPLFWKHPEPVLPHYGADLPHNVLRQAPSVLKGFDLWADEASRTEYIAQLKWRLTFDFNAMGAPDRSAIYFPKDLVELQAGEVFVDCGAFDGDTLELFLNKSNNSFRRAFAFEPDPANFTRLSKCVSSLPESIRERVKLECAAIGEMNGKVSFSALGEPSSSMGQGSLEVNCLKLDDVFQRDIPTFLKMDIEGAELGALQGAEKLVRERAPLLAISCYHRQDHLWSIPLLIHSFHPNYDFYLRPHDLEGWDLVCYAIPRSRRLLTRRTE